MWTTRGLKQLIYSSSWSAQSWDLLAAVLHARHCSANLFIPVSYFALFASCSLVRVTLYSFFPLTCLLIQFSLVPCSLRVWPIHTSFLVCSVFHRHGFSSALLSTSSSVTIPTIYSESYGSTTSYFYTFPLCHTNSPSLAAVG